MPSSERVVKERDRAHSVAGRGYGKPGLLLHGQPVHFRLKFFSGVRIGLVLGNLLVLLGLLHFFASVEYEQVLLA
ncbi:MAG TPA: hypothetical protein VFF81_10600 [Noviherbaspirillum sp.]|nr:hypothetical protein [Noviherbaspirillum sp.]